MKKFFMAALVIGLVFSMAQVTVADDRLETSGDVRIRAINHDNDDGDGDLEDNQKFIDSRFRLGLKVTVAEGITANLRADFFDDAVWGTTGAFGRPASDGADIEIDRMFIRIEKDMFIFQGGQIFQAFGNPGNFTAYAPNDNGMALRLKLPVTVDLNYFKLDENTGDDTPTDYTDVETDEKDTRDTDMYAIQVWYPSDTFTIGGYYVLENDAAEAAFENKNVIGVWGNTKLGPVKVSGALDFFGGTMNDATDYMGTQLWLAGEMAVTETVNVGLNFYYALAADSDGEVQLTGMDSKLAGFEAHENAFGDYKDTFTVLVGGDTPYDPSGDNAGVMGFDVYGMFTAIENVTLGVQAGYFTPQDDDEAITQWNSSTLLEGSVVWQFAPKCDLMGAAFYRADDYEDDSREDAEIGMVGLLSIAW